MKVVELTAIQKVLIWMYETDYSKIFTVIVKKRTDGSIRTMHCRLNVQKHLKGGEAPYNFLEKGLIPVCDLTEALKKAKGEDVKSCYRTIALEGIIELRVEGEVYHVD